VQLAGVAVAPAPGRAAAGHALDQASGQAQPELGDLGGDLALAVFGVCWFWHALLLPHRLRRHRRGSTTECLETFTFKAWPGAPHWPGGAGALVLVQRVLMPGSGRESWTLLGDGGEVVEPAERYLAYLTAIERSPNTVRAYAVSLKLWFEFLQLTATRWDQAGVEDVARFVAWLRAPAGNVIVLADGSGARGPATVNR